MEVVKWIAGLLGGGFFIGFGFYFGALAAEVAQEWLESFYARFDKPTKGAPK